MNQSAIREALRGEDAELRRQAVIAIAQSEDPTLAADLLAALGDEDWRVREEAINTGRKLAESFGLIDDLVEAVCQGKNVGLRNAALELLGQLGSLAVAALVAALPTTDEGARKFVVEALARSGDPSVVDTLVKASAGGDSNLVAAVIEALAVIGGARAEDALSQWLVSPESFERLAAVDALNRLGAVIPWETLEPMLSDRLVFRLALEAAGRTGAPEAIEPALQALTDRSTRLASTAVRVLCDLAEDPTSAEIIGERLRAGGESEREALRRIAHQGDERLMPACAQLLSLSHDRAVFELVVELAARDLLTQATLAQIREWGMDAVRGVFGVYTEGRTRYGATALELAGELAERARKAGEPLDEDFVTELRAALRAQLQSNDPGMLVSAARTLGLWGEPDDAARLLLHASSEDDGVRRACYDALRSLSQLDPAAVGSALVGVDLEGPGGAELTALVASLGGAAALPRLQTALLADDPDTRCAAIAGVAEHGGAHAAELIALSLTDESPQVQAEAARALGQLRDETGAPAGVEPLLLALDRAQPDVQAEVARALGCSGDRRAIARLRDLLGGAPAQVLIATIDALRKLRDEELGDALVGVLAAEDSEVVKAALSGLAAVGGTHAPYRIAAALEHEAWDVRLLAAELLAEGCDPELVTRLRQRLEREQDALVRDALSRAIEDAARGAR